MDDTQVIVAIVASVVTIVAGLVGIFVKTRGGKKAGERAVMARNTEGPIITGDDASIADRGGVLIKDSEVTIESDPELREQVARNAELIAELQEQLLAGQPGAPQVEAKELAAQAPTERTERLLAEAVELQNSHKEREAIERLLTAYDMEMPEEAKVQLHLLAGNGFLRLSELEEAESHYRQVLDASTEAGIRAGTGPALGNLGLIYQLRGELPKSKEHHQQSLAIALERGNQLGAANSLGNLGLIYRHQGDFTQAKAHHEQALEIHREIGYRPGEAISLGNLGLVYQREGQLTEAEEHHEEALAIHREIGYRLGEAEQLGNLGIIYEFEERKDLAKAEDYYRQALAIHGDIGNRSGEAASLGNLGLLAADREQKDEACRLLKEAVAIYEEIGAGGQGPETVRAALEALGCS